MDASVLPRIIKRLYNQYDLFIREPSGRAVFSYVTRVAILSNDVTIFAF